MSLSSSNADQPTETPTQRDARMAWWREARFGMFIHWGVYAVPAGTHDGRRTDSVGEWIMLHLKIPVADYRAYAKQFNPVKYDPDAWVRLAKAAGMKYIVITSKHHDGFALFDSAVTDWDVVDATPYGQDLLKPLVAACKKHGLKIGFYYSQAQDWTHPGGAKWDMQDGEGWDAAQRGSFDEYLTEIAIPQVKEILTNYDIDVLWWDTPRLMTPERADRLRPLLKLRPDIIANDRLLNGDNGDFRTPEQHIPATGLDYDWETCMTMNGTWGYKSFDTNWKSTQTLVRNLVDIASKGGNYLLNVGPTAEGEIPAASIERLEQIGAWMQVNSASIYGTTASPFTKLTWGRCTKKLSDDGATLYLHVFDWPGDGELLVPGLQSAVASAALLINGQTVAFKAVEDGVALRLPAKAPDAIDSVVVLKITGELNVQKIYARPDADGTVTLLAELGDLHVPPFGRHAQLEGPVGQRNIGYWTDADNWVEWPFKLDEPASFDVFAEVATLADGVKITATVGGNVLEAVVPKTGDYKAYQQMQLGRIKIDQAGMHTLAIKPVKEGWQPINLRRVMLRRMKKNQ